MLYLSTAKVRDLNMLAETYGGLHEEYRRRRPGESGRATGSVSWETNFSLPEYNSKVILCRWPGT
jgi:hypothetical protein